jgi:hypothetical protein
MPVGDLGSCFLVFAMLHYSLFACASGLGKSGSLPALQNDWLPFPCREHHNMSDASLFFGKTCAWYASNNTPVHNHITKPPRPHPSAGEYLAPPFGGGLPPAFFSVILLPFPDFQALISNPQVHHYNG